MINNYAIIENDIVINIAVADEVYAQEQGWILAPNGVTVNWRYIQGEFLPPLPTDYSEQNKQQATTLLQQTDWTCTVDITNPQYSNPYLMNQDAFLAYRSQVRAIAVNPPTTRAKFPPKPDEVWSS